MITSFTSLTSLNTQNNEKTLCTYQDIKARMEKEFKLSVTAECEIMVNDEGEITGVDNVRVYGDKLTDRARSRICEVYGLKPYEVHDE